MASAASLLEPTSTAHRVQIEAPDALSDAGVAQV